MAVVPMQKISLLVHQADKPKVLAFLQEKGVLQIADIGELAEGMSKLELDKESHELEFRIAELDFAVQFLSKYEQKKKGMQAMIDGDSVKLNYEEMEGIAKDYQYEDMVGRCKSMEDEMVNLKNEIKSIHSVQEKLMPWRHLKYALNTSSESESSVSLHVSVPLKDWSLFKEELVALSKMIAIGKEKVIENKVYVQILCEKEILNQVTGVIATFKVELVELPLLKGTIEEELERLVTRLEQIGVRQGQLNKVAVDFSKELKKLRVTYDYYNWRLQQKLVRRDFASTESTILIKGWITKKSIEVLKTDLQDITSRFVIEEINPEEGENAPVLLVNKGIMKPFQSVTDIYGLPLPNELDPTPYLAIFFIMFYGLALTDAIYGLLMFAIMFSVLRFLKIPKQSQGLIRLLMYAGLITFFAGALYGGWASMTPYQAPGFLTKSLLDGTGNVVTHMVKNDAGETVKEIVKVFKFQKIDAIKSPLSVLILSLLLGFIQVFVGVLMNFIWKFKHESKKYALIDHFPWVYLLFMIGFAVAVKAGILPESLWGTTKILLYIGMVGIVLTQGREKKNIILKFISGVLGLYGLVGYLSDVLSYSRLLALGLATSIIGLAVNTIAGMVSDIPFVGIILAIIVLIVGHMFNIGINALGAFIHSGRLQFVEFFTKFMEGGGQAFKPLKRDSKYVRLND